MHIKVNAHDLEQQVNEVIARMEDADTQLARWLKNNPDKRHILNGQDITEQTVDRLQRWGIWEQV